MMYEVIDTLCDITGRQANLIRKMSEIMIHEGMKDDLEKIKAEIEKVESDRDLAEMRMRHI